MPTVPSRAGRSSWPPVVPFSDVDADVDPDVDRRTANEASPSHRRPPLTRRRFAGLRVCHVVGGGDEGGALSLVLPLLQSLLDLDVDVELICLGNGGLADKAGRKGLPTTVLSMSSPLDLGVIAQLAERVAGSHFQIVHTHGQRATMPLRFLRRSLPETTRLFTTVHSDVLWDYQSPVRGALFAALDVATSRANHGVICVSQTLKGRLAARGFPMSRMAVVRPSLPPDPLRPGPLDRWQRGSAGREMPEAMRVIDSDKATWIGTAARLVRVKDLDLMLEASAELFRRMPDARLAIMGRGPEQAALERHAEQLGIRSRVAFTGWLQPIWPAMMRLSAYWLSSMSEGLPISILEAMATGLPVVATDVGGVAEAVSDQVDGFLVPRAGRRSTAAALADAAGLLLADPGRAKAMGSAGARKVAREFGANRAARLHALLYERALAFKD